MHEMTWLRRASGLALLTSVMGLGVNPADAQVPALPRAQVAERTECLALALLAPPSEDKGVSGVWKWTAEDTLGKAEVVLTLKQKGETVTGTISARERKVEIKDGSFKDGELSFALRADGSVFATKYKGKVKGNTLSGRIENEDDGKVTFTRDWEAERSPE